MKQLPIQVTLLILLTLAFTGQLLVSQEKPKDLAVETAANVPELAEFHKVIYKIYHYSMPQNSLEEVKASVGQLQDKMAALNKATLPVRFRGKEESFTEARGQLDKAVAQLATTIGSNDSGKIKIAVEAMHASYQALAKILE